MTTPGKWQISAKFQIPSSAKFQLTSPPEIVQLSSSSGEDSPEYEPMHNPYRKRRNYDVVYDRHLPESTVAMKLSELAVKHAQSVPFRVEVTASSIPAGSAAIEVGSTYTVHLVRETKVLVATEKNGGEQLQIPINSSTKIGLAPQDQVPLYRTVGDVLSAKQLPKAISAGHQVLGADNKAILKRNEVLLVKEAVKGKLGHKTALRVFSLLSHKELVLARDCDAEFVTSPKQNQCYVTDLLDNDMTFLPCSAYLYPSQGGAAALPVTITRRDNRRSMIISKFNDTPDFNQHKQSKFIDLPTSADVRVTILATDQSSRVYDRIYEQSQHLLTNHSPSQIQYCVSTAERQDIKAILLAQVREGRAMSEMVSSAPLQYHKFLRQGIEAKVKPTPQQGILQAAPQLQRKQQGLPKSKEQKRQSQANYHNRESKVQGCGELMGDNNLQELHTFLAPVGAHSLKDTPQATASKSHTKPPKCNHRPITQQKKDNLEKILQTATKNSNRNSRCKPLPADYKPLPADHAEAAMHKPELPKKRVHQKSSLTPKTRTNFDLVLFKEGSSIKSHGKQLERNSQRNSCQKILEASSQSPYVGFSKPPPPIPGDLSKPLPPIPGESLKPHPGEGLSKPPPPLRLSKYFPPKPDVEFLQAPPPSRLSKHLLSTPKEKPPPPTPGEGLSPHPLQLQALVEENPSNAIKMLTGHVIEIKKELSEIMNLICELEKHQNTLESEVNALKIHLR